MASGWSAVVEDLRVT